MNHPARPAPLALAAVLLTSACVGRGGASPQSAAPEVGAPGVSVPEHQPAPIPRDTTADAYALEIAADEPVAHWPLRDRVDNASVARLGLDDRSFPGGEEFTLELWTRGTHGTLVSYLTDGRTFFRLDQDERLLIRLGRETVETGVLLPDYAWTHVAVTVRGGDGQWAVLVDGVVAEKGVGPRLDLPAGGTLSLGALRGDVRDVVWHDRALHPSRLLSHVLVAAGLRRPTLPADLLPLGFQLQTVSVESVQEAVFNPDASLIAAASRTGMRGSLQLWDAEAGILVRSFAGAVDRARAVAFSPDGRLLASGGAGLALWDVQSGAVIHEIEANPVRQLAFRPDGRLLAAATDSVVLLVDPATGERLGSLPGTSPLAFMPDGSALLARGEDGDVLGLWDPASGQRLRELSGHEARISAAEISPDGSLALSGDSEEVLKLWDLRTGEEVWSADSRHDVGINDVAFASGGTMALSVDGFDGDIKLWNVESGREVRTLPGRRGVTADGGITHSVNHSAEFDPSGRYVLAAGADGAIRLWNLARGTVERTYVGSFTRPQSLALHPNRTRVVAGRQGNPPVVWDLSTLGVERRLEGELPWQGAFSFSQDGRRIRYVGGDGVLETTEYREWDAETGRLVRSSRRQDFAFAAAAFDSEGRYALIGAGHNWGATPGLELWDVEKDSLVRAFEVTAPPLDVALSRDGRLAAAGGGNEEYDSDLTFARTVIELKVWDTHTGGMLHDLRGHEDWVSAVALSPDGGRLLSGDAAGAIRVWDMRTGRTQRVLTGHEARVTSVAFTDDGRSAVSGAEDRTVRLWDLETGREIRRLGGEGAQVTWARITDDGRFVLAGRDDETIRLWDLDGGGSFTLISIGDEWLAYADDGLFDGSRDSGSLVSLARGTRGFRVDQLALTHNRPDVLLERLGAGTTQLREHYAARHRARLAKVGLDSADAGRPASLPRVRIASALASPGSDEARLEFHLSDVAGLLSYQLYVDDVPLYPGAGREVSGRSARRTETIRLTPGLNKVEVSALNVRARESLRAITYLWGEGRGIRTFSGHSGTVEAVAALPDGARILTGGEGGDVRLWDTRTGETLRTLQAHTDDVISVAVGPDGLLAISGGRDAAARLWDLQTGAELYAWSGGDGWVTDVAFSPDGRLVAYASTDFDLDVPSTTFVREAGSGRLLVTLPPQGAVRDVVFSPDGTRLATAGEAPVRIWDLSTGRLSVELEPDSFFVNAIEFTRDGRHLVVGSAGGEVRLRNLSRGEVVRRFSGAADESLRAVAVSPEGNRLATAGCLRVHPARRSVCQEGVVRVWDVATGEEIDALTGRALWVEAVAFGSDGNTIAAGWDGQLVVWDRERQRLERPALYYLGFGVSEYRDERIQDLAYAHKDAQDLAALLAGMEGEFRTVHVHTFTDEEVTRSSIAAAKELLRDAGPEDIVVLFVAGHGLHDTDAAATYYYLTHDADPHDLAGTAAEFDLIEGLLSGIRPRQKLFLLDTCQSGEAIPEESYLVSRDEGPARALTPRVTRGLDLAPTATPRRYLAQDDRFIYADLTRRTGAIVFSSALGFEPALEDATLRNGVFTYAILEALTTSEADENGDGFVSTDELRAYVMRIVPELTGGLQHPTVDRDNIYLQFSFPVGGTK